jgi:subtilase family serine protease
VTCVPTGQPDLTITNIAFTFPAGDPPNSYTVTVQNIGSATADVSNSVVQGYYTSSTDTTMFPPPGGPSQTTGGDAACGTIMQPFATTLAPGASVDVVVGCSAAPNDSRDTNLMVIVDENNIVAESNENNNVAVVALP